MQQQADAQFAQHHARAVQFDALIGLTRLPSCCTT
jgi:hypothetical protein